jgi:hypothetical protein
MQIATSVNGRKVSKALELGLCFNCLNVGTCVIRAQRAKGEYVMFCNEHDGAPTPAELRATRLAVTRRLATASSLAAAAGANGGQSTRSGLCATCERDSACALPRGEGGTWQCEEFA